MGARLAHPEAQLTGQALALPDPQVDGEALLEESGESFAIPEAAGETHILGTLSKDRLDRLQLDLRQPTGTTGMNAFGEARQPLLIELADPILNALGRVAQEPAHLRCGHSLSHEEESVEAMVVSGLVGPADLILQGEDHVLDGRYGQWSHEGPPPSSTTRNH